MIPCTLRQIAQAAWFFLQVPSSRLHEYVTQISKGTKLLWHISRMANLDIWSLKLCAHRKNFHFFSSPQVGGWGGGRRHLRLRLRRPPFYSIIPEQVPTMIPCTLRQIAQAAWFFLQVPSSRLHEYVTQISKGTKLLWHISRMANLDIWSLKLCAHRKNFHFFSSLTH